MPDDDLPAPEPPTPEQPTLLGGLAPDEMIARAMQTVRMTSGAMGTWQPPSIEECALLFPGYEVLRLLGRGGMGAVYQARQIELDRLVAIKLLPLEISVDKDFADRFRREARAMAKLNHPNIIAVHDFGTTREGHLFFVMEYVEGANLADIIHQVGLEPDQSLSIAEQVCIALAYAHNKGIVHRDIKPANVMVDTESHVKVADFGLARLTDPGAEQLGHTMTGTVMGTPDYMAPEQCKAMNVDHRADIYSLGVMIYEMMCREVPKGIFDPPSHRTGCDARIDGIVIRAMQQSPERRYQSTQEMRTDITTARTPMEDPQVGTHLRGVQGEAPPNQKGRPGGASLPAPKPPRPAARPGVAGAPPRPPQKPPTPMAARPSPVPSAPPETSVMQAIKPPASALAKKSKLPLYGGIGLGIAALAVAAFLFTRPEKLTKAQIYAREHAGEQADGGTRSSVSQTSVSAPPAGSDGRAGARPSDATKDAPFVNTLGMKFVPVPGTKVLFSIWDTRVQDYATYAGTKKVDDPWTKAQKDGVPVGRESNHPVVGVSWEDAQAFCQWLTEKETAEGTLPKGLKYRLPTDEEWSWAVGLPPELGATPAEKSGKNSVDFPWGKDYPPRGKVGNYADESFRQKFPKPDAKDPKTTNQWIHGYDDGYATTSPVGSFPANGYGLYDMGGNVWQWCEDWFDASHKDRVLRGAGWNAYDRNHLLSSHRYHFPPRNRDFNYGFRCVLAPAGAADGGTRSGVSQASAPQPSDGRAGARPSEAPHLSLSSEPWVDAMKNANLLKVAVKEGAALRATDVSKGLYLDLSTELKDGAVRMLYTADASAIADCSVHVRRTLSSSYNFHMEPNFQHLGLAIIENGVGRSLKSFRLPAEAQRPAGQPTELELRVVGTTLIAKANGFEAFRIDDSKLAQGHLGIRLDPGVLLHAVQTLDLSKGGAASAPVAPTANPNPAGWENAVHLLPLIQPEKDAVAGVWKIVDGRLQSDTASNARLQIPYQPPEEYDYRLVFSYQDTAQEMTGGQVQQILVKKNHLFQWVMGAPHGNNSGFEMLAGANASGPANPTRKARDPVLARSVTHTSIVEVRNDGLKAWLDGEFIAEWKTDYHDLTGNPSWKLPDERALGVGAFHTALLIESIDVREVTGKGTFTRGPAPPAAAAGSDGRAGAPSEGRALARSQSSTSTPPVVNDGRAGARPSEATKDAPFVNSLGMKFVPVPIVGGVGRVSSPVLAGGDTGPTTPVLFSIWDTRVQDYDVFAKETKREWPKPDFEQGPTHPAVNVSWDDAQAFCAWLTERERKAGKIGATELYRLPTDHEWSCAVGIGDREDATKPPSEKKGKIHDTFPWGTQWPPPKDAGNYAGEELRPAIAAGKFRAVSTVIAGYNDGFVNTSPVGSFAANRFGLYDMGGNVWQWCEDWYDKDQKDRVVRGASWGYQAHNDLLSSFRGYDDPGKHAGDHGFRSVLAPVGAADGGTRSGVSPTPPNAAGKVGADKAAPSASPAPETGFRPLFDGKTLAGWRSYPSEELPADWRVTDGAIVGGKRSYLVTKETFGDFDLRLEWKVGPKGNGGIFFRMPPGEGNLPRTAPEFQLSAHDDPDKYKTGALYNVQMPSADVSLPEGQWNTARLVVQGNHVEHWVNDQLVLSYELQSDDWKQRVKAGAFANVAGFAQAPQGWIGLQGWVGETAYRNIRIRPLSGR